MTPGPEKSFDPEVSLRKARDTFWSSGFEGASLAELEASMGIGRKSLYDTFGSKRELYLRALEGYADTVIEGICQGLCSSRSSAGSNLERVLRKLQQHHASEESCGCLLGVAMAQADVRDAEVTAIVNDALRRLERAFAECVEQGREGGELRSDLRPKDVARSLVALIQGMALVGRVSNDSSFQQAAVRSVLAGLR